MICYVRGQHESGRDLGSAENLQAGRDRFAATAGKGRTRPPRGHAEIRPLPFEISMNQGNGERQEVGGQNSTNVSRWFSRRIASVYLPLQTGGLTPTS